MEELYNVIKIGLVGDPGVGKEEIIKKFIGDDKEQLLKMGMESAKKKGYCSNGKEIMFQIWNTAGQDKYRSLSKSLFKDLDAIIMVYDMTKKATYEEIKNYWEESIKNYTTSDIILAIAANNSDLLDKEEVDEEDAREYAKSIDAIFMPIFSNCSQTVRDLFSEIGKKFMKCEKVAYEDIFSKSKIPPKNENKIEDSKKESDKEDSKKENEKEDKKEDNLFEDWVIVEKPIM